MQDRSLERCPSLTPSEISSHENGGSLQFDAVEDSVDGGQPENEDIKRLPVPKWKWSKTLARFLSSKQQDSAQHGDAVPSPSSTRRASPLPDDEDLLSEEDLLAKSDGDDHRGVETLGIQYDVLRGKDAVIEAKFADLSAACRLLRGRGSASAASVLLAEDVALVELMLHHGADADQVDGRVLAALLDRCCGQCQRRSSVVECE